MKPALLGCRGRFCPNAIIEIKLVPASTQRLPAARTCQQNETNHVSAALARKVGQDLHQPADFFELEKPITRGLRVARKSPCRIVGAQPPSNRQIEHFADQSAGPIRRDRRRALTALTMLMRARPTPGNLSQN